MSKRKFYDFSQALPFKIYSLTKSEAIKHSTDGELGTTYNLVSHIMKASKQVNIKKHACTMKTAFEHLVRNGIFTEKDGWYKVSLLVSFIVYRM